MPFLNFGSRRSAPSGAVVPGASKREASSGRDGRFMGLFGSRTANRADALNDRLLQDIGLSRADYEALRG